MSKRSLNNRDLDAKAIDALMQAQNMPLGPQGAHRPDKFLKLVASVVRKFLQS